MTIEPAERCPCSEAGVTAKPAYPGWVRVVVAALVGYSLVCSGP
jgi:hypothetical protein